MARFLENAAYPVPSTAYPVPSTATPSQRSTCAILAHKDLLNLALHNSHLWMSNFIVALPYVETSETTLFSITGGDVYLTDMIFIGNGVNARAIDVKANSRLFISSASTD